MADQPGMPEGSPFDIAKIRQLIRLMRENEVSEIDLRWENSRVRLRRGGELVEVAPVARSAVRPAALPAEQGDDPAATSTAKAAAPSNSLTIVSPIVGTFYPASGPEAEPFVSVGSRVTTDTIVCIIEAMKVFNEIPAGLSGTITQILVEKGAPVEYGQPLFRVEP